MKNKKKTRDTLLSHGVKSMDYAFYKKFGFAVSTDWDTKEERYVTLSNTAMTPEHHAFLAGYSKALNDMFIAARL